MFWTSRVGSDARIDQLVVLSADLSILASDPTQDVHNKIYSRIRNIYL